MDADEIRLIDALAQALAAACSAMDEQMVRDVCTDIRLVVNDHGLLAIIAMVKRRLQCTHPSRRPFWVLADVANDAYKNMTDMSVMLDSLSADGVDSGFAMSKADPVTSIDSTPYAIVKTVKEKDIGEQQTIARTYFFDDRRCTKVLERIRGVQDDVCDKPATNSALIGPVVRITIKRVRGAQNDACEKSAVIGARTDQCRAIKRPRASCEKMLDSSRVDVCIIAAQ
jgi:hypothetical protein